MAGLYLVPVETVGDSRGPKYFRWAQHDGIGPWSGMDYGFLPTMLVYAPSITNAEHAALTANLDVYYFAYSLNESIKPNDNLALFCEGLHIPTDWLTPANTYGQFLRVMAGMFQFLQRYGYISGGDGLLTDGVTLDTRYRNLGANKQAWFNATVESFGYPIELINPNASLRQMLKSAGDLWGAQPFKLGGMEF